MFHYVYQITNKVNSKMYIGSRTSNIEPANDLGKKYFSSSKDKEFQKEQRENPENFIYEVLSIYNNKDDMLNEEIRLHNLYEVGKNLNYYNKSKQTSKSFSMNGRVNVKDKDGNILSVSVDDPRYLSGELVGVSKGLIWINNGIIRKQINKTDDIPKGWKKGLKLS